jgi:hypothetical protein
MKSIISAAHDYIDRGWPVLQLHRATKTPIRAKNGYIPPDGSSFFNTLDHNLLDRWFREVPNADIGVETGPTADFWVFDIDGEAGRSALRQLEKKHGELPKTVSTRSGGNGQHHYFKWPVGRGIKTRSKWKGVPIDSKGRPGGQVVMPPSSHRTGNVYSWVVHPDDCEIVPAPAWVLDFVTDPALPPLPRSPLWPTTQTERQVLDRACKFVRAIPPAISGSKGSAVAMTVARALRWGFCFNESTAFEIFIREFNDRCLPPWSEKEIRHKLDDATKPDPYGRPYGYLRDGGIC